MTNDSENIKVGFIGCGRHSGLRLYPGMEEAGLDLIAVCDADPIKAQQRATRYAVPNVYSDWQAMCDNQSLDAVLAVTGPAGHYELGTQLLERGYHLFTEKPCSVTSDQADHLVQCAEASGKHMQIGFNYRYTMGVQRAVSMIENQQFADPAVISVRWWLGEPDTQRFMQHYVCHGLDLLHYVTPGGLTHLDPQKDLHIEYVHRDNFDWYVVTMRSVSGAIVVLELGPQMSGEGHYCRIDFTSVDGLLSVHDFTQVSHYETAPWGDLRTPDSKVYDGDRIWRTEPLLTRGSIWQTFGYAEELRRFRQAVQGTRKPEATVAEAAWGMHVMDHLVDQAKRKAI